MPRDDGVKIGAGGSVIREIVEIPSAPVPLAKKHNKKVGGSENSSHLWGMASDVSVTNSLLRYRMIQCAQSVGIMRIGIANDFIHFDTDYAKTNPVIWTY